MSKSKSSKSWLKEHFDDAWVQRSKADGYRSRASYKLLEIQKSDRLIKPGMTIVDLGSAPGGWSQVAAQLAGAKGTVIASDILAMDAVNGVVFVQGDFTEEDCFKEILSRIPSGEGVDLVISDMAPNLSGMAAIDQPRSMHLVELALDFARITLKPGGCLLAKVFQGEGFESLLKEVKQEFSQVLSRKPGASRARSKEIYLLAKGYKN
ncbi:23S rRNA (uridine(2552)-2'-O)-methyltransferase RlmE [Gammaproteobacteria bacterium]|nr:23S rRNA (uridine(2552)-2'-O)-methyltransferase RlmE [Gammaproteobacteria bacterium]